MTNLEKLVEMLTRSGVKFRKATVTYPKEEMLDEKTGKWVTKSAAKESTVVEIPIAEPLGKSFAIEFDSNGLRVTGWQVV